jgi:RNA polymerase sigma factor (sigma-70 family)
VDDHWKGVRLSAVYLDAPAGADGETNASRFVAPTEQEPEAACDAIALVQTLPPRERRVVERLFAESPETLEHIGESMGVTKERVRQIKEKALERMRRAARSRPWAQ